MKHKTYIVTVPSKSVLDGYIESHPWYDSTMKTIPGKAKMRQIELSMEEIAQNIEKLGWCIFPITAEIGAVKSYRKIGMTVVFIQHYYRDFRADYKEYLNIL